jgi:multiple sugar transport system permease protein
MISEVVAALGWRLILSGNDSFMNWFIGLFGAEPRAFLGADWAMFSVILVEIWMQTPFVTLLLYAGMLGMPQETLEAAEVDGVNGWSRIRYVVFPLLQPIILIVLLFRTIFAMRTFGTVYVLTQGGPAERTTILGVDIFEEAFTLFNIGRAATMAVGLTVLCALMSVAYIRFLGRDSLS